MHPPYPGRRPGALLRRPAPWRRLGGHGRLELLGGAPAAVLRGPGAGRAGAEPSLLWPVREGAGAGGAPVPAGVLRVPVPVGRATVQHAGEGGLFPQPSQDCGAKLFWLWERTPDAKSSVSGLLRKRMQMRRYGLVMFDVVSEGCVFTLLHRAMYRSNMLTRTKGCSREIKTLATPVSSVPARSFRVRMDASFSRTRSLPRQRSGKRGTTL